MKYVLLVLALAGCVVSVEPVIPAAQATFDSRLLGTWQENDGADRAVIARAAGNLYHIDYSSDGKHGTFEGRLGRLGKRLVLDVSPEPRDSELQPYSGALIAGHVILAVEIDSGRVRLAMLRRDSLRAAVASRRVSLAQSEVRDRLILRGTTGELRAALSSYLSRPGALDDQTAWRRVRAP